MNERKDIEDKCEEYVLANNGMYSKLKFVAGAGFPDGTIWCGGSGKTIYVEFKRPGGNVKPLQMHTIRVMKKFKQSAHIIDSVETFKRIYDKENS